MKKIAINGFGRIGRLALRQIVGSDEYKVVAINSLSKPEELAYLFKYDTIHGFWEDELISYNDEGIIVDGELINTYAISSPKDCPWQELEIDLVLECSGVFTKEEDALMHIEAGAKHVIISAPSKGNVKTIVYGVNEDILTGQEKVVSTSSCTTNCLAPILKLINDNYQIEEGYMTTIHAYTNDQMVLDGEHRKGIESRRGRAAAQNIIPTSTGAAKSIDDVIPDLKDKLNGIALRVPVPNGSCLDLTLRIAKATTPEEINNLFIANQNEVLKFTLEPIVSSDVIGTTCASLIDGSLTKVIEKEKKLIKIIAWYDNEYGYTAQMLRTMEVLLSK